MKRNTAFLIRVLKNNMQFVKKLPFVFSVYKYIFLKKYAILEKETVLELKRLENMRTSELLSIQKEKLLDLLDYSYKNCSYYKKIFDQYSVNLSSVEDLQKIPVLTKSIIRENLDELISNRFSKYSLGKSNTGGSTGEPLEFYRDSASGAYDNAHHWYLYSLMGYEKGDTILDSGGTFVPKELRDKNIYWTQNDKDSVWGEYCFSVLYITDDNLSFYIQKFKEIKPAILRGYPSFFNKLATYIIEHNITFDFKIKGANLTAEMCSESQRENIEKAFACMVYFEYGHSEVSVYCYTKDNSYIYQSSPIYGYVEVIKEDGAQATIGEVGSIVVTGFNNYGMPFIRYDTGDIGEVYEKNAGIVKFSRIMGRSQDYIVSKDDQKVFLTALIFGQHLKAFKNMKKWQLVQNEVGKVIINIVKNDLYSKEDEEDIFIKFTNVANMDLIFHYVDDIPLTKRGKHLFLIQNIGKQL